MFNIVDPNAEWNNPLVYVFIIFGTLLFVKDLPKLLETITGMKLGDGKGFGIRNKVGQTPLIGGLASKGLTTLGGYTRAGGRVLANTIGGKIKKGFGNVTGWEKAKTSGQRTLDNRSKLWQQRISAARKEGNDRMASSGWLGDSGFKGTTVSKTLAQQKAKMRETSFSGLEEKAQMNSKWKRGDNLSEMLSNKFAEDIEKNDEIKSPFDLFDGKNAEVYQSVYSNKEFISSIMKLDDADSKLKILKKEYDTAYANGTMTKELQGDYEKQVKIVKGLEAVHETMRKAYAGDAETQDALKFRKNNENNPAGKQKESDAGNSNSGNSSNTSSSNNTSSNSTSSNNTSSNNTSSNSGTSNSSTESANSSSGNVTYTTLQENINNAAGVGYSAAANGAPTAENSVMQELAARHNYEMQMNAEAMQEIAQSMANTISSSISDGISQSMGHMGDRIASQISSSVGDSIKKSLGDEFKNGVAQSIGDEIKIQNKKQAEIIGDTMKDIVDPNSKKDDE